MRPCTIVNDDSVWFASIDNCAVHTTVKAGWSLDSVRIILLTPHGGLLNTYETVPNGQHYVTVASGYKMLVVEVCTVPSQMTITASYQSNKILIKNVVLNHVVHTPESKEFLVSVCSHTEKGLKVKFDRSGAVISEKHVIEGTAKRVNRMYAIDQCDSHSAYAATTMRSYI